MGTPEIKLFFIAQLGSRYQGSTKSSFVEKSSDSNLNYSSWRTTITRAPDLKFCLTVEPIGSSTSSKSAPRCRTRLRRRPARSCPSTAVRSGCYHKDSDPSSPQQHGKAHLSLATGLEPAAHAEREPPSTPAEPARSALPRADETASRQTETERGQRGHPEIATWVDLAGST